jgi:hypothetical protein
LFHKGSAVAGWGYAERKSEVEMTLSRKRQKELKRLKKSAEQIWEQQRQAIDQATLVLKDARRQASNYAREEVRPMMHETYHGRVKPVVATGVAGARYAARTTRTRFADDVKPAMAGAVGAALAVLEAARDPRVREVVRRASRKPLAVPAKKSGPGKYILIGLGVVAVAGIAYAAWQTLRVDEDLWVEDLSEDDPQDRGDDEEF